MDNSTLITKGHINKLPYIFPRWLDWYDYMLKVNSVENDIVIHEIVTGNTKNVYQTTLVHLYSKVIEELSTTRFPRKMLHGIQMELSYHMVIVDKRLNEVLVNLRKTEII